MKWLLMNLHWDQSLNCMKKIGMLHEKRRRVVLTGRCHGLRCDPNRKCPGEMKSNVIESHMSRTSHGAGHACKVAEWQRLIGNRVNQVRRIQRRWQKCALTGHTSRTGRGHH